MTVDVPSEYEPVIAQAVMAGLYSSQEDVIRRALELFLREHRLGSFERLPSNENSPPGLDGTIPDSLDVDEYVGRYGAKPIASTDGLKADFWPSDLSVEDFLEPIYECRRQETQRGFE